MASDSLQMTDQRRTSPKALHFEKGHRAISMDCKRCPSGNREGCCGKLVISGILTSSHSWLGLQKELSAHLQKRHEVPVSPHSSFSRPPSCPCLKTSRAISSPADRGCFPGPLMKHISWMSALAQGSILFCSICESCSICCPEPSLS